MFEKTTKNESKIKPKIKKKLNKKIQTIKVSKNKSSNIDFKNSNIKLTDCKVIKYFFLAIT